jgi:MFS family permease
MRDLPDDGGVPARAEFRRSWPVVMAGFAGIFTGVTGFPMFVIGPFLPHYQEAFGWSATAISLCSTCMGAGMFFTSPITGYMTDRFGVRKVALISQLMVALCFFGLSFLGGSVLTLYALYFAIGALGSGTGPITYSRAITGWFEKKRGLALGLTLAGVGLASALAPLLVQTLSEWEGWRSTWRALALLVILCWPVVFWGLKEPPHNEADLRRASAEGGAAHDIAGATLSEAVRNPRFYVLVLTIASFALFIPQLIIHFVPSMIERGMSAQAAAGNTALLGVALIAGRLGTGWMLDRIYAPYVALMIFAAASAGCATFALVGAPAAAIMILATGLLTGAEADLMAFLTAKYFGLRHFGRVFGVVSSIYTGTAMLSPAVATPLRDFGGYPAFYLGAATSFAIGAVAFLLLGPYRRDLASAAG